MAYSFRSILYTKQHNFRQVQSAYEKFNLTQENDFLQGKINKKTLGEENMLVTNIFFFFFFLFPTMNVSKASSKVCLVRTDRHTYIHFLYLDVYIVHCLEI